MSPPTGTVISTSWEYNPVQSTRRKSPDSEGRDVVIFGKKTISCLGGSEEGVWNDIFDENALLCLDEDAAGRTRMEGIDLLIDRRRSKDIRDQSTTLARLTKSCEIMLLTGDQKLRETRDSEPSP
jgi:hypothetical protein